MQCCGADAEVTHMVRGVVVRVDGGVHARESGFHLFFRYLFFCLTTFVLLSYYLPTERSLTIFFTMSGAFYFLFFFSCVLVQGAVLPRGEVLEGRGYEDID